MVEGVKRPYRSAVRELRSAQTRAAIRTAAARLFVERGYAATSMRGVAEEAGVGERTVYAAFPGKAELYAECLGVATAGDEREEPVPGRPEVAEALGLPDPGAALAAVVGLGADLLERAGDLIHVGLEAAAADPAVRELMDQGERATHGLWRRFCERLADRGELRAGLAADDAADAAFTLASPHVHHLLRRGRGWTAEHYRAWLSEATACQLFDSGCPEP